MYLTFYLIILEWGEFKSQGGGGSDMLVTFDRIHCVLNLLACG